MRMQANPTTYKGVKLDSGFEQKVIQCLEQYFPLQNILCHKPVLVRPESKWFPAQNWKVDFTVCQNKKPLFYVEAKGYVQLEFKEKMKNLAYLKPEIFERLVVICPVITTVVRGFVAYDLKTLDTYLKRGDIDGLINSCKKLGEEEDV